VENSSCRQWTRAIELESRPRIGLEPGMRPRHLVFITLLTLCHPQLQGQALTNALPPAEQQPTSSTQSVASSSASSNDAQIPSSSLPDDPDQQLLPVAQPEPAPTTGVPLVASADNQTWVGNVWTGTGNVELHYRDYIMHAEARLRALEGRHRTPLRLAGE